MASKSGKEVLNTFSGGMNLDIDSSLLKNNQYRYAENARVSSTEGSLFGAISQIEKTVNVLTLANSSYVHSNSTRDIAVVFANTSTKGVIYRLEYEGGDYISSEKIFLSHHKFSDKMSSVIRYDSDSSIRCYFSEENNPIRVIDISAAADDYNYSIYGNIDALSIYPPFSGSRPIIEDILSGRLNSGKIQYCYSLYSKFGTETSISELSELVNLTASEVGGKTMDVTGTDRGDSVGLPSGKAVSIRIPLKSGNTYDNIKIYSIYYSSSIDVPIISMIADSEIKSQSTSFNYVDAGNPPLDILTVAEFNAISQFKFTASQLESKDDILFAGNIKETKAQFPEYDVRAFRFNSSGKTLLHDSSLKDSSALNLTYSQIASNSVPSDHDCILKETYEKERFSDLQYIYNKDGYLGGSGANVEYLFSYTYLIESYGNYLNDGKNRHLGSIDRTSAIDRYIDNRIPRVGDITRNINTFYAENSDGSVFRDTSGSIIKSHKGQLNYSNPLIANKLASYQRDEIYRFAAILHDKDGNKSDARWIADIRFPSNYFKDTNFNANSFLNPQESYIKDVNPSGGNTISKRSLNGADLLQQELLVKPMGLKFTFNNIPSGITRIEIVRSKRDLNNKTIFAQGVVQKVGTKKQEYLDTSSKLIFKQGADNTLRPHPIIAMGYSYSIAGPVVINDDATGRRVPTLTFGYIHSNGNSYNGESNNSNGSQNYLNYTDHAIAPFHSNKGYNLFINPETSYYRDEFVGQIKNISASLSVENIIFPKSTPLLSGMQIGMTGNGYFGNSFFSKLSAQKVNNPSSEDHDKYRPTAMYFGADLSDGMIDLYGTSPKSSKLSDSIVPFAGLVGISGHLFNNSVSDSEYNNDVLINTKRPDSSIVDSYRSVDGQFNDASPRVYISLGNSASLRFVPNPGSPAIDSIRTWNGLTYSIYPVQSWNTSGKYAYDPISDIISLQNAGYPSVSFKYYCGFDKATQLDNYGALKFSLLWQNSNEVKKQEDQVEYNNVGEIKSFKVNSMSYSGIIDSGVDINASSVYHKTIDGMQYLNWSAGLLRGDSTQYAAQNYDNLSWTVKSSRVNGVHGDGIVLSFDSNNCLPSVADINCLRRKYTNKSPSWMLDYYGNRYLDRWGSSALSTFVMNMKAMNFGIYGGQSYKDKLYSEYISTGYTIDVEAVSKIASGYIFGGDTYIGIFDYTVVKATDPMSDSDLNNNIKLAQYFKSSRVGAMIPLESSINMRMSSSKTHAYNNNLFCIQDDPGVYGPALSSGKAYTHTQKYPQFKYNSAYSAEQTAKVYLSDINISDNLDHDNRVLASGKKSYGEKFDSWGAFKPANYIDVDSTYGQITRLKSFDNKLFFWQNNAVGVLSVNDRSLIQDNSLGQLTLGTGGILSRYDYISTSNGISPDSINSIGVTPLSLYWFDKDRNEVMSISSGASSASKKGGIQASLYLNRNNISNNVPIGYDGLNNEVLITLNGIKDKEEWLNQL